MAEQQGRFIAQRILTGEWLHWDVPLDDEAAPRRELSGPGALSGRVPAGFAKQRGLDGKPLLWEWATALYVEMSGEIRWGGIVTAARPDEGGADVGVECVGFAAYPVGLNYLGFYKATGRKPDDDVFAVVRHLWDHVQSQPDGNLGVVVDGHDSGVAVGSEKEPWRLTWWETPDVGETVNTLASEIGFEYAEEHRWAADGSSRVEHRLRLGYPRLGRKRDDLRFAHGENITSPVLPEADGEGYANEVYVLGKGEGRKTARARVPQRDGRLRRVFVHSAKRIGDEERLARIGRRVLAGRNVGPTVPRIEIADHANARIGSWRVGDDILVEADAPGWGRYAEWHRVVGEEIRRNRTAALDLVRTDATA